MNKHFKWLQKIFPIIISTFILLTACRVNSSRLPRYTATPEEQQIPTTYPDETFSIGTSTPELMIEDTPTLTPGEVYWISEEVPSRIGESLAVPTGMERSDGQVDDVVSLGRTVWMPAGSIVLGEVEWVFALVAPFKTVQDDVTMVDLKAAWSGKPQGSLENLTSLAVYESDYLSLAALLGGANSGVGMSPMISLINDEVGNLRETLSVERWAIVPFDRLQPEYKVISVDGVSPLDDDLPEMAYGLEDSYSLYVSAEGFAGMPEAVQNGWADALPGGNRNEELMTSVVMTGVTALVRATAYVMETQGIQFPGRDIVDWLRAADVTHVSNEVSFSDECSYPDPYDVRLSFCSRPGYIGLLDFVGVDVVELTGNHNNDATRMFGVDVVPGTLALYEAYGMRYFGGGVDLESSRQPALFTHNGNKLAFIGCNAAGPDFAWATGSQGGAAPCGDFEWMESEISRLKQEGYLPIATFQYYEDYGNDASEQMKSDFGRMAEAGAVIVNGSQAHTPKTMDFVAGTLVHYGLGNLFFDQMTVTIDGVSTTDTRNEFIQRHIFYDGRYISTELLTARLEDWARPRPMTTAEREAFLTEIFKVQ